jgi:hypothetical protein
MREDWRREIELKSNTPPPKRNDRERLDFFIAEIEYAITTVNGDPSIVDLLTDAVARAKGETE